MIRHAYRLLCVCQIFYIITITNRYLKLAVVVISEENIEQWLHQFLSSSCPHQHTCCLSTLHRETYMMYMFPRLRMIFGY